MKIQRLRLKNFKRFSDTELNFCDPETGLAKDLIVLVGENRAGISSLLQAIAAMLGCATGRLDSPASLVWPGFDWDLIDQTWSDSSEIELTVTFNRDEIEATREYFARLSDDDEQDAMWPAKSQDVTLTLNAEKQQVSANTLAELYQFRGREYARLLFRKAKEQTALFERVGTVFWYTEQRTTNSLTPIKENGHQIHFDMNLLRRRLSDWMSFHERITRGEWTLRSGQRDIYANLTKAYQTVFPHKRFFGTVPRANIDDLLADPWFYLFDGQRTYELGEMSGGERAIFPILLDFANWNINHSVILIDELELHLHPPLQQGLLGALRRLGKNNQFIITTHSDAVAAVIPPDSLYRLEVE